MSTTLRSIVCPFCNRQVSVELRYEEPLSLRKRDPFLTPGYKLLPPVYRTMDPVHEIELIAESVTVTKCHRI
jgi:hypothetical protein